jgi:cysteinyl-tRNA synthetase
MDDDFNSAGALAALFDFVRVINQTRADGASNEELHGSQTILRELCSVLGLQLKEETAASQADGFVDLLVELRTEIRKQKLWAMSDRIRDRLGELGVVIEDSKEGTTWRWK